MAVSADQVVVDVIARVDRAEADMRRWRTGFEREMGAVQRVGSSTLGFLQGVLRGFGGALAGVSVTALAAGMINLADRSRQLTSQLKLATAETGSFGQAQRDVQRIAAETRSGLEETGTLYSGFVRNARDLGITQAEAARATETFSKTLKISGSSAAEAAGGTRQFTQALQSGVLRGDEFNSIMENSPRLARLLADSLNVPIGRLRAMAEEGELTADKLVRALTDTKFTEGIDAEFRQMPVTFDQAMTEVYNAALTTFGAFDRGGEFSTMIANFISGGADGFASLEKSAEQYGIKTRAELSGLHDAFEPLVAGAFGAFDAIDQRTGQTVDYIKDSLEILDWLLATDFSSRYTKGRDATADRLSRQAGERAINERFGFGTGGFEGFIKYGFAGEPAGPARVSPPKKKGPKGPSAETLAKRAEAERQRALRDDARADSDLRRAKMDELRARQDLAIDVRDRGEIAGEMLDLEYEGRDAQITLSKSLGGITDTQAEQLRAHLAIAKQLEWQKLKRDEESASLEAMARADEQIAQLREEGLQLEASFARTAKGKRAIELRLLDERIAAQRAQIAYMRANPNATPEDLAVADRHELFLDRNEGAMREQVRLQNLTPLESFFESLPKNADEMNEALEAVYAGGITSIIDGLADAATGARSLGDVFKNVAQGIIRDLIQIQIRKAIVGALGNALGMFGGGSASAGGGDILASVASGNFTGPRASGGPVQAGKLYRINEGARPGHPEGFIPAGGGTIVPLGRMNVSPGGGATIIQNFTLDARGGVMTAELIQSVDTKIVEAGKAAAMAGASLADQRAYGRARRRLY